MEYKSKYSEMKGDEDSQLIGHTIDTLKRQLHLQYDLNVCDVIGAYLVLERNYKYEDVIRGIRNEIRFNGEEYN